MTNEENIIELKAENEMLTRRSQFYLKEMEELELQIFWHRCALCVLALVLCTVVAIIIFK